MKSFILSFLSIAVLTYIIYLIFPWWTIPIAGFLVGLFFRLKGITSFLSGLLGVGLVWLILVVTKDAGNDINIASSMGELLGGASSAVVYIITTLIGGIIGGLGMMTGGRCRLSFNHRQN